MQTVFWADNLHNMPKYISKKSTKKYFKMPSAKMLPRMQSVYLDLAGEIISFTLIPYQLQFEPLR